MYKVTTSKRSDADDWSKHRTLSAAVNRIRTLAESNPSVRVWVVWQNGTRVHTVTGAEARRMGPQPSSNYDPGC